MNNKIKILYDKVISGLSSNIRSLPKIDDESIVDIINEFQSISFDKLTKKQVEEKLTELFCILTNTQTTSSQFRPLLEKAFDLIGVHQLNKEIYILFLSAAQKQIIDHAQRTGERIPQWMFIQLKKLLHEKDPEIIEWSLRTISMLQHEGLYFKDEIEKLRPNFLKIFNRHQQYSFEIIDHMKKEWKRLKNEKKS